MWSCLKRRQIAYGWNCEFPFACVLHSTNPIERLGGEIKRQTEVVGIFSNEEAIVRLDGALLLEPTTSGPSNDPAT